MSKKLLIDARQSDETRVVLLNKGKIENFDYETSHRKPIKGNIYLARITRVEPSLQAAFVEYGGNRQAFLPFGEIHPDYYRIPVEDREKLLKQAAAESDDSDDGESAAESESGTAGDDSPEDSDDDGATAENGGGEDDADEARARRRRLASFSRHYKIQEVVSRRQIMLIQVVKEERGGKGAAVTTYISLAGRYCVLMPNSHNGGGVSRKIANQASRKKLKTIVKGLDVPSGMAVIVRTAGSERTKAEITRDFTYLMRQWDDIRNLTMKSIAPALIHEEGNLIKRAVRDYYAPDVDEIVVEGEDAYNAARLHMKNLMPSHVKKVKMHEESGLTLMQQHQAEDMLASMHDPRVTLKSGGYLIINQAEALVAVDVNSGRSTRERNIEETALKTNLEAAEEIGHQLRFRDLSGLIVIDFIDMDVKRNQSAVERKLKEAVKSDRARIRIGSISQFGLLEMSRQRLRSSLAETVSSVCPHCEGSGRVHSAEVSALFALRSIETEASKTKGGALTVRMHSSIAFTILNNKRAMLAEIEERFSIHIDILADDTLVAPQVRFGGQPLPTGEPEARETGKTRRRGRGKSGREADTARSGSAQPSGGDDAPGDEGDEDGRQRRRRRRGKRGGRRRRRDGGQDEAAAAADGKAPSAESADGGPDDTGSGGGAKTKAKKARRKKASSTGGDSRAASTDGDSAESAAKAKLAKKSAKAKSTANKSGKAAKASAKAKSAKKSAKAAKAKSAKAKSTAKADSRSARSSADVEVVDVDNVAPSTRKKGWWSS